MTPQQHARAKVAYDAYGVSRGYRTYDKKNMPKYENLGTEIQLAWYMSYIASANHALTQALSVVAEENSAVTDAKACDTHPA